MFNLVNVFFFISTLVNIYNGCKLHLDRKREFHEDMLCCFLFESHLE